MANVLTTNPIILDTAGATSAIARRVFIKAILWYGATNSAHTCVIHDASGGNIVFGASVTAAGEVVTVNLNTRLAGIYLTTLGSGTVLIYL